MQGCILQERRGIVERKEPKAEDHVQELDNGRLDDDGHEDTVARGGSREDALAVSTVSYRRHRSHHEPKKHMRRPSPPQGAGPQPSETRLSPAREIVSSRTDSW